MQRRFIAPMTVVHLAGYFGFLIIAGSASVLLSAATGIHAEEATL